MIGFQHSPADRMIHAAEWRQHHRAVELGEVDSQIMGRVYHLRRRDMPSRGIGGGDPNAG